MSEIQLSKGIHDELKSIKKDLSYIKKNMVDIDSIMTEEDYKCLNDYRKEKSSKKLISHNDLKKQLGL